MNVRVARSAGFCSGVKRALALACATAKKHSCVVMLGDIVHNEDVVRNIAACGIKKIQRLGQGEHTVLLIRAHGASRKTIEKARQQGYTIVDATCPMVKEIHTLARNAEKDGYTVIIIGDRKHDEVQGILGQLNTKALVIDTVKQIRPALFHSITKAAVVVQSTQNTEKVSRLVNLLKAHIPNLKFHNTICNPTRIKQKEIKTMPLKNDVMLIIGSKTSANTRRLYEISQELNRNTYWIQSKKQIDPRWFEEATSVGITAGASTPEYITDTVIAYVKALKR